MVTFSCEICNDSVLKKKAMQHYGKCPRAFFTCIDCNTTFEGRSFQQHTSCISEAQKYEGALYTGGNKGGKQAAAKKPEPKKKPAPAPVVEDKVESKPVEQTKKDKKKSKKESTGVDSLRNTFITMTEKKQVSLAKILKSAGKDVKTKSLLKKINVVQNSNGDLVLVMP